MVLKAFEPARRGVSLTAVTVMLDVAAAELKLVMPPLVLASTFVPAEPLVWSQARNVTLPVVPFWPSGIKRSLSVERRSNADESLTLPTPVQVLPSSVEYSQDPLPLVRLVTAMPFTAPTSTSLT